MKNKEKIKRYTMAVVSFCFMLVIAGYINYKYNPEREKDLVTMLIYTKIQKVLMAL